MVRGKILPHPNKPLVVPNKPFMVALGTSHTHGVCMDNELDRVNGKTAHEMIANEFDFDIIRIGLPGASNQELLQTANELSTKKVFSDSNCKLVMLEARMCQGQLDVPFTTIGNRPYRFTDPNTGSMNDKGDINEMALIEDHPAWGKGHAENWGDSYVRQIYDTAGAMGLKENQHLKMHTGLKYPLKKYEEINMEMRTKPHVDTYTLLTRTPYQNMQDMTFIDAIKNIVVGNGVKFLWESFDANIRWYKNAKLIFGDTSNIFDYCVNEHQTIRERIVCLDGVNPDGSPFTYDGKNAEEMLCSCHHANDTGHRFWFNFMLPKVKEVLGNI
jgi:hypothetical protein